MIEDPLDLITVFLFLVTWRAANAAKRNADIAAREFKLLRQPLVTVTWDAFLANDHLVVLNGKVSEVAGLSTTLHSVEVIVRSELASDPVEFSMKPNSRLCKEIATFPLALELPVPGQWAREMTRSLASIEARLTISLPFEEAAQEEWLLLSYLRHDPQPQENFTVPAMSAIRLGKRDRQRRSRLMEPVLGAWERWWNSVC